MKGVFINFALFDHVSCPTTNYTNVFLSVRSIVQTFACMWRWNWSWLDNYWTGLFTQTWFRYQRRFYISLKTRLKLIYASSIFKAYSEVQAIQSSHISHYPSFRESWSLAHFMLLVSFYTPWRFSDLLEVFWSFRGVQKEKSWMKQVKNHAMNTESKITYPSKINQGWHRAQDFLRITNSNDDVKVWQVLHFPNKLGHKTQHY